MTKEKVLELKEKAEFHWEQRREHLEKAEIEAQLYQLSIMRYRIASADRVLESLREKSRKNDGLSKHDTEVYLGHCRNKLAGNIDGIELNLGE